MELMECADALGNPADWLVRAVHNCCLPEGDKLWERATRLGGQAGAFPVVDTALEYFYHHLFTSDHAITELIEELGISESLIWPTSNVGFFANGKIYPLSSATDLLRFDAIPLIDRIRIGVVTLYLQKTKSWKKFERVTAASWLRRAIGDRAFDRVWGARVTRALNAFMTTATTRFRLR